MEQFGSMSVCSKHSSRRSATTFCLLTATRSLQESAAGSQILKRWKNELRKLCAFNLYNEFSHPHVLCQCFALTRGNCLDLRTTWAGRSRSLFQVRPTGSELLALTALAGETSAQLVSSRPASLVSLERPLLLKLPRWQIKDFQILLIKLLYSALPVLLLSLLYQYFFFSFSQANDSVQITWVAPTTPSGRIMEYSMYMAVRKSRSTTSERPGQMAFIRIYRGTKMSCSVSSSQLDNAHIDYSASNRPAVVFRIAAKNEQGYGPATQIRWIQGGAAWTLASACYFLQTDANLIQLPVLLCSF